MALQLNLLILSSRPEYFPSNSHSWSAHVNRNAIQDHCMWHERVELGIEVIVHTAALVASQKGGRNVCDDYVSLI